MSDPEKDPRSKHKAAIDPTEEAAAAKLWSVYISEAEKYDKSLVESWKNDMEGILIFAGLFSASLTAFIIESYPTLVPDSGDATVQLLSQISQQLAAAANGSTFQMPTPTPSFSPPATSLVCNTLWFISLGLSLSCALIATLVEQWARDFLHKADMRSAPGVRARIFSFLYYGLKEFNMHKVVDVIPLLLHLSLLLFFAGLVAFLIPINIPMACVVAFILALIAIVYSAFTILPLYYLDCPYRTPLSEAFRNMSRGITRFLRRRCIVDDSISTEGEATLVEAMSHAATEDTQERDYRALVWTVKSLADDTEFEPFTEAIPDVLWGPKYPRFAYRNHFKSLMNHPDLEMHRRFLDLFHSCDTGLLLPEASKRRRITYYKALWALGSVGALTPTDPRLLGLFNPSGEGDKEVKGYAISANAMVEWSLLCSAKSSLSQISEFLARDDGKVDLEPDLDRRLGPLRSYLFHRSGPLSRKYNGELLDQFKTSYSYSSRELITILVEELESIPRQILISYMTNSIFVGSQGSLYRYRDTVDLLTSAVGPLTERCIQGIHLGVSGLISGYLEELQTADSANRVDAVILELSSMVTRSQTNLQDGPVPIPKAIIDYICIRKSDDAVEMLLHASHFQETLFSTVLAKAPDRPLLRCLWRATLSSPGLPYSADLYESLLNAVETSNSRGVSSAGIVTSLIASLRVRIIRTFDFFDHPGEFISRFLPTPTMYPIEEANPMDDRSYITHRNRHDQLRAEAQVAQLGEFLETMQPNNLPYAAAETLNFIAPNSIQAGVHERHQNRLADGLARLWDANLRHLLDTVLASHMFDVYPGTRMVSRPLAAWLDDRGAREKIQSTLVAYLSANAGDSPDSLRARAILEGLESLHAVPSDE